MSHRSATLINTLPEQSARYKTARGWLGRINPDLIYDVRDACRDSPDLSDLEIVLKVCDTPHFEYAFEYIDYQNANRVAFLDAIQAVVEYERMCIAPPTTGARVIGGLVAAFDQHICA